MADLRSLSPCLAHCLEPFARAPGIHRASALPSARAETLQTLKAQNSVAAITAVLSSRTAILFGRGSEAGRALSYAHVQSSGTCFRRRHVAPLMSLSVTSDAEAQPKLEPTPEVLEVWRAANCVCFDVDSTVCVDEGIDELAAFCGAGEAVAAWTARAMGGSVPFEDALAARLDLFQPSAADLASFLARHPPRLSPGIKDLVDQLLSKGKTVYLISGGFRQMIEPTAALLGIPKSRIFANRLLFNEDGSFAGFDREEPTSRSGGKAIAIEMLKKEHGYPKLVMLGDGATDLEARRPGGADLFIGYGGVQVRSKVAANADWFVYDFEALIGALDDA